MQPFIQGINIVWHCAKVQAACAKGGGQRLQQQGIGVARGNARCGARSAKFVASGKHAQHCLPMHGHMLVKLGQQGNVVCAQFCSALCEQGTLRHVCPTGQHMQASGAGLADGNVGRPAGAVLRLCVFLHYYGIRAVGQGAARVYAPGFACVQGRMANGPHAAFASQMQQYWIMRAGPGHIGRAHCVAVTG